MDTLSGGAAKAAPGLASLTGTRLASHTTDARRTWSPRRTFWEQQAGHLTRRSRSRRRPAAAARKEASIVSRTKFRGVRSRFAGRHVAAWVLIAALPLAACSDGSAVTEPMTSTSTPATASEPTPTTAADVTTLEAEIVARYEAFWDARFAASQAPVNPDDPELRAYATGAQLENVIAETRERLEEGLAFRWPENSVAERRVQVLEVTGDEATLVDCATNDGIVYHIDTGEVIDDSVVTRSIDATMQRVDSAWKLAEAVVVQEWEGVAGCALADDV